MILGGGLRASGFGLPERFALALFVGLIVAAAPARADDDFGGATVIFARKGALYRVDPRGRNETQVATLPGKGPVRALRTDAAGKVLLFDQDGAWYWLPLDGSAQTPGPLPCAAGPAQIDEDATCVLCAAAQGAQIVNLAKGKSFPYAIPIAGARLTGVLPAHRLVWVGSDGVWAAPPGDPKQATKVAPEPPLRDFLASPDGSRAVGVYGDEIYVDAHHKQPAEVLYGFKLDGEAARREGIRTGVPVAWSHDSRWVLVQDGPQACLMAATGGEYKCWRGFTATSIASDGKYALVQGRPAEHHAKPAHEHGHGRVQHAAPAPAPAPGAANEGEGAGDAGTPAVPDVLVPPPSGPVSLYLAHLEGSAYVEPPTLVARDVDGGAVWVPGPGGGAAAPSP